MTILLTLAVWALLAAHTAAAWRRAGHLITIARLLLDEAADRGQQ